MALFGSRKGTKFRARGASATLVRFDAGDDRVVEVPAEAEGKPVTKIAPKAFEGNFGVEVILLPETVTEIGKDAFAGCASLREISLPYGLLEIGARAFKDCTALEAVYYFSKRGISSTMRTDYKLREDALPIELEVIGEGAFENCSSLRRADIPYRVREIPARAYAGCSSLERVGLHNLVTAIGDGAFSGCDSLATIRLPYSCAKIGKAAFASSTCVIASPSSAAAAKAEAAGQSWRAPSTDGDGVVSVMQPRESAGAHTPFATDGEIDAAVERFELREPAYERVIRSGYTDLGGAPRSRFDLADGVYASRASTSGRARLMMVGDLMATTRQQRVAAEHHESQFGRSFNRVKRLLGQADFVIGNVETMASPSAPYSLEVEHVNARPHLNSPPSFLAALRRAGFDCISHAQNHVYDAGTRGVFETLDAANRCQLMHVGAYASAADPRYVVAEIGGIKVGVVAYLDQARQAMKRANFTKTGRDVMFPSFEQERVEQDIVAARTAGAEFIIAYCHWGREYTAEITPRQRDFGMMVANAGADYIVGAHSHCIQPYEVLETVDGRLVPCLWSAGNFMSSLDVHPPITRDSLVLDVVLERDSDGSVRIASEGFHPCRIMQLNHGDHKDFQVVPTSTVFKSARINESLVNAQKRIEEVTGPALGRLYV